MANGNSTPSGIGQINASGDRKALWLKVFSGEVLTTFQNETHMLDKHQVRTISSGKSAQFPVTGTAMAKYHVPGQNIADADNNYLNQFKHNEKVIGIDGLCLSSVFISNIEEAMSHYDVRSTYAMECGRALANHFDKSVTNTVVAAARTASPNISGLTGSGGLSLGGGVHHIGTVGGQNIVTAAFKAAEAFDRKDVPKAERYLMLRPAQYYALIYSGLTNANNLISRDYNEPNGSLAKGRVYEVAGFQIVMSNHLPGSNLSADALLASSEIATENDVFGAGGVGYGGNFALGTDAANQTVGLAFQKGAVGTVKLLDLATESEYQIERQGTLMVCKYAMGHGVLRPECAMELRAGTGTDVNV
jgi:hypothetical protein